MRHAPLDRRTLLRATGAALALPFLESMAPVARRARAEDEPARRLAVVYVPNGVHMPDWTPPEVGAEFALPFLLEPLRPVREELLVVSGLAQDKARANGDGPGDHARAAAAFLTGAQPFKSSGTKIHAGISADQVAAAAIGGRTRLRSLEVGCESGRQAGECDSGYSCVYSNNIAWRTPHTPMTKEVDPRLVFDRLFRDGPAGETPAERERRRADRRSVLDLVRGDAQRLAGSLGAADRRKLDEYLTGIRELERRIARLAEGDGFLVPTAERPSGVPPTWPEHVRVMYELLALAFQADVTRIATFQVANEGSGRSYPWIDVPEGHHALSHHGGDAEMVAKIRRINRWHMEEFARFLQRLAATPDGPDGAPSLLARSLIVFGSGIADGNRHTHHDLPLLVAGRGADTLVPGRHLRFPEDTPANGLHLSLLDRLGVTVPRLGDATEPLVL